MELSAVLMTCNIFTCRYPWDHPHLEDIEGENYSIPDGCAQYYIAGRNLYILNLVLKLYFVWSPAFWQNYFVTGHLPQKQQDYKKRYRTLASTYLTFSPDGSELLANLGGEQIYLFDVNKKLRPRRFDLSILSTNGISKGIYFTCKKSFSFINLRASFILFIYESTPLSNFALLGRLWKEHFFK